MLDNTFTTLLKVIGIMVLVIIPIAAIVIGVQYYRSRQRRTVEF